MFMDNNILPLPYPFRFLLSKMISSFRYKKSWEKYKLIGGTPIIESTKNLCNLLNRKLGEKYIVNEAFSYSQPLIKEAIDTFDSNGINDIIVIPLYPQSSFTTTKSIKDDIDKALLKNKNIKIKFIDEFYSNPKFVVFWTLLINNHISKEKLNKPLLLFSAHSIPEYLIEKGDKYNISVENSAKLIANNCNLNYKVSYQSKMGRMKWIGPDTVDTLNLLSDNNYKEIIIIPISFVSENLETLYDLDKIIVPDAIKDLKFNHISRVNIDDTNKIFIDMLADICNQI